MVHSSTKSACDSRNHGKYRLDSDTNRTEISGRKTKQRQRYGLVMARIRTRDDRSSKARELVGVSFFSFFPFRFLFVEYIYSRDTVLLCIVGLHYFSRVMRLSGQ